MLENFIPDALTRIENADNPTLMAIFVIALFVLRIVLRIIQLGLSFVTGSFRNDKTQFGFMRDLLKENIETRKDLKASNEKQAEINQETLKAIKELTATLTHLNNEVRGIKSTTHDAYALLQTTHQSGQKSHQLLQDNVSKLDDLITKIDDQHSVLQSSDQDTQDLLQQVLQRQHWLHLRLLSDYPQLALPKPKKTENTNVHITNPQPSPSRPQGIPPSATHLGAA